MAKDKPRVYPDDEVAGEIAARGLTHWYLEDGWLRRRFSTGGWPVTLMLVNAIGFLAEQSWHHPDLNVTWGKVWVKWKTHSAGGITDKDLELARRIEDVARWQLPEGSALDPNPNKFVGD